MYLIDTATHDFGWVFFWSLDIWLPEKNLEKLWHSHILGLTWRRETKCFTGKFNFDIIVKNALKNMSLKTSRLFIFVDMQYHLSFVL